MGREFGCMVQRRESIVGGWVGSLFPVGDVERLSWVIRYDCDKGG